MRVLSSVMLFGLLTLGCQSDSRFTMPDAASDDAIGSSCSSATDCASGLCIPVGDGENRCSKTCGADFECPTSWGCTDQGGTMACACGASAEVCNDEDDDCDLSVDEGTGEEVGCAPGEVCSSGTCGCPPDRVCAGACIDTDTDANHCGGCGNDCPSGLCVDGSCCTLDETTAPVDLLFVIDGSNSMGTEQASLAMALPRFFSELTSDIGTDLHVGVIDVDLGTGGNSVTTCDRAFGGDGVLRTEGGSEVNGCAASYPSFLAFSPGGDVNRLATDSACMTIVGTDGCGFEQQLEAMIKSVTPASAATRFSRGTTGHADGANAGFLRAGSTLAIVMLSDEEDCSASDDALFSQTGPYEETELNLRCFMHPDALHPVSRYVDGLIAQRGSASDIVFVPIVGVPVDLAAAPGEPTDYPRLIGSPAERDERMIERVDPSMQNRLVPSCNVPGRGLAFPPVRIVQVARDLEARGARVSVQSICQESMASPMEAVRRAISAPRPNCE